MTFRSHGFAIDKVGIVGSGQIGPDIALAFARAFGGHGVSVVVLDLLPEALEHGRSRLEQKLLRGGGSRTQRPEAAAAILETIGFTTDDERLRGADLIIEAATENLATKRRIFARLEELCDAEAVLASNSSHLTPDELFTDLAHPERALVIHYFFPADRNPLVEVVPGGKTGPELTARLLGLYEAIGKVPVQVASRYGYAVDPVFEGLFLAAALAVEEGLGTTREVDAAARRALGQGVGPFTAMNLTGGNPITDHGLDEMTGRVGSWFRSPRLLKQAIASGEPWDVGGRGEDVSLPPEREARIGDLMRGAYFGLAGQILDSGIVKLPDLEMALELGLVIRPPFQYMSELGLPRALELVDAYAVRHPDFQVPRSVREQATEGRPFRIDCVFRRDVGEVAVLTIRRPRVLNALDRNVYAQLREHFTALRDESGVSAVVLTGFGTRAFVSGADVHFLAELTTPEDGIAASQESQALGNLIENLGKPVICALNGSAIGGGNELAMSCTARIARKGLAVLASQPEVNLGILPGAGATQRLPRLVGIDRAGLLLRTGRPLSGAEAVEWGLIRQEVDGDVVEAAVALARAVAGGEVSLIRLDQGPMEVPAELRPVDLGHLSRAIDELVCRAILEGCRLPLPEGLRVESELFGACCRTEDMRIGLRGFLAEGPRSRPAFVHH